MKAKFWRWIASDIHGNKFELFTATTDAMAERDLRLPQPQSLILLAGYENLPSEGRTSEVRHRYLGLGALQAYCMARGMVGSDFREVDSIPKGLDFCQIGGGKLDGVEFYLTAVYSRALIDL